ncbi:GerMN domain-containing protein [Pleurocapsales cyanobacterium LEGE 06147]|nr:GerMN domain-containing protein [Pleurocapsales cyanobacterium LEGE 06147]
MHNKKQRHRFSPGLLAGIGAAILILGGGIAWWAKSSLEQANRPPANTAPSSTVDPSQPSQPVPQERQVEVYWLKPIENRFELVASPITFPQGAQPEQMIEVAFENLLSKPEERAGTTAIPPGTKLLDLQVDNEGVHVNLSQEFTAGGGSASMTGRLAQVIYTATSLNSQDKVWINVEGKPLEYLGGEGLEIRQPMTRQDFEANFTL